MMYWQVYLHKLTAAELMLQKLIKRAKYLLEQGEDLPCDEHLKFFLTRTINKSDLRKTLLNSGSLSIIG